MKLDVAMSYLLDDEGRRYTNDPHDAGGPTKFGITKKVYESYFMIEVDDSVIEQMTEETARLIYSALYWGPLRCEQIDNLSIAVALFDTAVLFGEGTASLILQKALSLLGATLKIDGLIGDKTVGFVNMLGGGSASTRNLLNTYHGLLVEHIDAVITRNPNDERFRHGWVNRADRLLQLSDSNFIAKLLNPNEKGDT